MAVNEHVRVCRDCGEEYRPEIVRCADCGGELEDRYPGDAPVPKVAQDPAPETELAGYRVLFMTARATDLVPMADRLQQVAIECRLAEQPGTVKDAPPRYAILVREGDARGALAAVTDLIAPHEDAADVHAVETRFDPEKGYLQCPACGASPPPGATECPECGLGLGGEEAAEEPHE
jgi:ribosomal protein L40E